MRLLYGHRGLNSGDRIWHFFSVRNFPRRRFEPGSLCILDTPIYQLCQGPCPVCQGPCPVLCVGCVLHGLLISSLCQHQTTTTLPFSSPFTTPLFSLSLSVWKRGWTRKWMVWNGVWCVACNTSATVLSSSHHQPLCVSRPSPFPSHSQTPFLLPSLFGLGLFGQKE